LTGKLVELDIASPIPEFHDLAIQVDHLHVDKVGLHALAELFAGLDQLRPYSGSPHVRVHDQIIQEASSGTGLDVDAAREGAVFLSDEKLSFFGQSHELIDIHRISAVKVSTAR
jgi:hypothetical protein